MAPSAARTLDEHPTHDAIASGSTDDLRKSPHHTPHTMKSKMQTTLMSLALAVGFLAAIPAQAQDNPGERGERPRPERQERRAGGPGGGMNIEFLKEQLGLTEEQAEKLKPILDAQREELAAKRKELGQGGDRAAMREATQAVREKYKAQIEAVLTPEQKEKLAKFSERQRRPGGPGGPGGPGRPEGEGARPKPKAEPKSE